MKNFSKIFSFEFRAYLKNKIFVGVTIFLMVAIIIGMAIPSIIAKFSDDEVEETDKEVMLLNVDYDLGTTSFTKENILSIFSASFTDYNVQLTDKNDTEMQKALEDGTASYGFILTSKSTFVYYVYNLSMYDVNASTASAVLQEVNRYYTMCDLGLTYQQASEVMSIVVTGETVNLGKDQMQNFFYTYIMIFALYMVILLYGQMVANNVASEKASRAMEVLITSANPVAMMFGKVFASCMAGFTQLVCIFGTVFVSYQINKSAFESNEILSMFFDIPLSLLIYMLVFFVLGFLVYAFLYGAIGSTVSKLEDLGTAVMPITFVFLFGFLVVTFALSSGDIDSMLMKICSYIPFTSPMAMFTRIAMSVVPIYEIVISIAILALSVVGVGYVSAKIYRVGVLLYGQTPKLTTVLKNVFRKS